MWVITLSIVSHFDSNFAMSFQCRVVGTSVQRCASGKISSNILHKVGPIAIRCARKITFIESTPQCCVLQYDWHSLYTAIVDLSIPIGMANFTILPGNSCRRWLLQRDWHPSYAV